MDKEEKATWRWRPRLGYAALAEEHLEPPEAGGDKEGFSLEPVEEHNLDFRLLVSRTVRE